MPGGAGCAGRGVVADTSVCIFISDESEVCTPCPVPVVMRQVPLPQQFDGTCIVQARAGG